MTRSTLPPENLDDTGREALNTMLKASAEARRFYREHMELHAQLHLDYTAGEVTRFLPDSTPAREVSRFSGLWLTGLAAAACIALVASLLWPRQAEAPRGFRVSPPMCRMPPSKSMDC